MNKSKLVKSVEYLNIDYSMMEIIDNECRRNSQTVQLSWM